MKRVPTDSEKRHSSSIFSDSVYYPNSATPSPLPMNSTPIGASPSIIEKNVFKTRQKEVAQSAFSFLFSEIVQYSQSRVYQAQELQQKLLQLGYDMGYRYLELNVYRDKKTQRETKVEQLLHFINGTIWKSLFGKNADSLERGKEEGQYLIYDKDPLEAKFISLPKELDFQATYFTAGIVKGILTAAEFPCDVKVFYTSNKEYTVYVVTLQNHVIERERNLSK